jgi:cell division protein FtsA
MAGCEISTVYAAISGAHVRGLNSHGIVAVKDKEVRDADIARVIDAAKAVAIPMDREVLHVLPQQYVVDDQDGIRDPLGMAGVRLEAKVHIVTTAVASAQNVIKCANRCNLQVADIVLESLASSQAVVEDDEKELGIALVDIGGGTCDVMVYADGAIVHTSVLPLGGGHVTNDIATVLRTPLDSAEKIKRKYGCAWRSLVEDGETMEVPSVGGRGPRALPRIKLVEVIEPRIEEIFEHVRKELIRSGYFDGLAAGMVLTGGATSMEGITEVAEHVTGLPTRRGVPTKIGGLVDVVRSPGYATGVGLVMFGAAQGKSVQLPIRGEDRPGMFKRAWSRLAEMF